MPDPDFDAFAQNATEPASPFGCCPYCGNRGVFYHVGRDHWIVCEEHRVKWYGGSNVLSCWRELSPEDWFRAELELLDYRDVTASGLEEE